MNEQSDGQKISSATVQKPSAIVRNVDYKLSQFKNRSLKNDEFIVQDIDGACYTSKLRENEKPACVQLDRLCKVSYEFEKDSGRDLLIIENVMPASLTQILAFNQLNIVLLPEPEEDWIFHQLNDVQSSSLSKLVRKLTRLRSAQRDEYTFSIAAYNYTCDIDSILKSIARLDIEERNEKDLLLVGAYIFAIFRSYYQAAQNSDTSEFNDIELSCVLEALEELHQEDHGLGVKLLEFAKAGEQISETTTEKSQFSAVVVLAMDIHHLYSWGWKPNPMEFEH